MKGKTTPVSGETHFGAMGIIILCLLCCSDWLDAAEAKGRPVKLVMLGDSVTQSRLAPEGDKVPQLTEKSLSKHLSGRLAWTVVNAGVGSETAEGGLRRVAGVLTRETPQFVTIAYGLNDCRRKDPKWFEQEMRALIDEIAKHPSKPQLIVLTATPFVNEHHAYSADPFYAGQGGLDAFLDRQMNAVTRRLAAERRLPLIDVHRAFLRMADWQNLIQNDGVHPTVEGNRLISEEVARGLGAYVEARLSSESKAANAEKSARAKLAQAVKAASSPANRDEAYKLLQDAADLCPYLAEVWVGLDSLEATATK